MKNILFCEKCIDTAQNIHLAKDEERRTNSNQDKRRVRLEVLGIPSGKRESKKIYMYRGKKRVAIFLSSLQNPKLSVVRSDDTRKVLFADTRQLHS